MDPPRTQYAVSGDVHIADQVFGEALNLVVVPGAVSHVELGWEDPELSRFYRTLGSCARVILFDKRRTGLSDRTAVATLEGAHG